MTKQNNMDKTAQAVKNRANKVFADMAKSMVDASETDSERYGMATPVDEERKYYPRLTIPRSQDYDKQPGDMCYVLALAEVKNVSEKSITLEIQKVLDTPAPDAEDDDEDEEDNAGEDAEGEE